MESRLSDWKTCSVCTMHLPHVAFNTRRASPDGRSYKCKGCELTYRTSRRSHYKTLKRAWDDKNRAQIRAKGLASYYQNRDARIAQHKAYMERTSDQQKAYRTRAAHRYLAQTQKYRTAKAKRLPTWLSKHDHAVIKHFYTLRKMISDATGSPHHVDHEVPLQGAMVSGLHVPWNLRIVPAFDNISKGNRHVA